MPSRVSDALLQAHLAPFEESGGERKGSEIRLRSEQRDDHILERDVNCPFQICSTIIHCSELFPYLSM